jgi:hypothetical protein
VAIFVTDSTVLTPGLLGSQSPERRLLVLCAYSRWRYYEAFGSDEVTNTPEVRSGAPVYGRPVADVQRMAAARAAALADRLPPGAPVDCLLALSAPILESFEDSLTRRGVGAELGMTADLSMRLRITAGALVAIAPAISIYRDVPQRVGRHDTDLLLETAAQARAEFVVSDSPSVVPLHGQDLQLQPGTETRVCSFESFVMYTELDTYLNDVDGSLIHLAVA